MDTTDSSAARDYKLNAYTGTFFLKKRNLSQKKIQDFPEHEDC